MFQAAEAGATLADEFDLGLLNGANFDQVWTPHAVSIGKFHALYCRHRRACCTLPC
jgi:hypothetical protein